MRVVTVVLMASLSALVLAGCRGTSVRRAGDTGVKAKMGTLGIEGKTYVHDLGETASINLHSVQRLDDDLLLQDVHGHLTYVDGATLNPRWDYYGLDEPFTHLPSATPSAIIGISGGKLHVLTRHAGVPSPQPRYIDVVPSAAPVAGESTVYVPTYRTPAGNKTLYSFGLGSGYRGWGWRTDSDITANLTKGGPLGGDTFYFASDEGALYAFPMLPSSDSEPAPAWTSHAKSTVRHALTVLGDDLGVVTGDGRLVCYDRITGNVRWEAYAGPRERAESSAQFSEDHAFYRRGGALHAYDRATGAHAWSLDGALGFIAERGDHMLIAGAGETVMAVETTTGAVVGTQRFHGFSFPPQPVKDGTIHAVSRSGLIVAVELGY